MTDDNGDYSAVVQSKPLTSSEILVTVSVSKDGWHFLPSALPAPAYAGADDR